MAACILLVEDDESLREVLTFNLTEAGFEVEAAPTGEEGLRRYSPKRHPVVLSDIRLPKMDGMQLLRQLRRQAPEAVVLLMTAFGSVDAAVGAMQEGAFYYVEKPINTRTLVATLNRAVEYARLGEENRRLHEAVNRQRSERLIIATSPAMNRVLRLVDKVADSDATILVRGESGTGKELIARAIHERSPRFRGPFVTVNCAAVPSELLESVLFGHEKGAFTGATRAAPGKFAAADRGTIFLDEIGEMSEQLQSKLLRVLEDGEVDVVGSTRPRSVDVRVVAATHRDLEAMVDDGLFRRDLFYRLNVVPITIPPLRQRPEDVPVLFRHFLRKHRPEQPIEVDRAVDEYLVEYAWPGNVRELENITKRMLLLAECPRLGLEDVPELLKARPRPGEDSGGGGGQDLPFELPAQGLDLVDLERRIVVAALDKTGGNQSAAARYLRIPRHVLLYRMEKFGLKGDT